MSEILNELNTKDRMYKKCKQCGRTIHISRFRKYASRKAEGSTRNTKVGENTVCMECEAFNANITRVFKKTTRTAEEEQLLTRASQMYIMLKQRGNSPIGAYARYVLGETVGSGRGRNAGKSMNDFLDDMLGTEDIISKRLEQKEDIRRKKLDNTPNQEVLDMLNMWLTRELYDSPEYYEEVYDDLLVACRRDDIDEEAARQLVKAGRKPRTKDVYGPLLEAVLERFNVYEDEYDWDKDGE